MISGCCLNNNFAFGGQLTYSLWPSKWLIFESSTLSFVLELMRGQLHQMLSSLALLLHSLMRRLTLPYKFCLTIPILLASHIISHQPKKTTGTSPESQGAGEWELYIAKEWEQGQLRHLRKLPLRIISYSQMQDQLEIVEIVFGSLVIFSWLCPVFKA